MLHYEHYIALECRNSTTNRHVVRSLLYALYNKPTHLYRLIRRGNQGQTIMSSCVALLYALLQHVIHRLFLV